MADLLLRINLFLREIIVTWSVSRDTLNTHTHTHMRLTTTTTIYIYIYKCALCVWREVVVSYCSMGRVTGEGDGWCETHTEWAKLQSVCLCTSYTTTTTTNTHNALSRTWREHEARAQKVRESLLYLPYIYIFCVWVWCLVRKTVRCVIYTDSICALRRGGGVQ